MRFILALFIFCSFLPETFAKAPAKSLLKADTLWLEKKLTKIGFSKGFIAESMKTYEPESFDKTLTLNLLTFLRPAGQHMNHVTPQSMQKTQSFILANQETFQVAQDTYKVSPEVISALLWIETRHGQDMGNFHTLSVYLHLLQVDRAQNRKELIKQALVKNKELREYTPVALRKLIAERTKRKAKWAEEELMALASARKKEHLNLKTLRGSYAGAFGLPQFIPSSYLAFATSLDKKTPDLRKNKDAIISVAHYLSKHGWQSSSEDAKVNALMKYNNSRDYADSILAISKGVLQPVSSPETPRGPTSAGK